MNKRNIPRYLAACFRAALSSKPRAYIRMLSRSPYTVAISGKYGIEMLVDVRDPVISKPIIALGEYEDGFASRLLSCVNADTRFLDIGANIGFFSLAVARKAVSGRVWSIEPDPQNVRLLRASVALNGFDDIVDVRFQAASDMDGELFFSSLGYQANLGARFTAKEESTLLARSTADAPRPIKVRAQTMDEALRDERIDLVKIDVEGHEPAVLNGMHEILTRERPVVFSEFAPGTIQHISKTNPADMLNYMLGNGYLISIVNKDGTTTPVKGGAEGIMARYDQQQHHIDLLFMPK